MSDDDDLFRAAQRGDMGTMRRLLEQLLHKDASLSVFDSALRVAIWNDHGPIVTEIVRLAGHNLRLADHMSANDSGGNAWTTHLMSAASFDSTAAARSLLLAQSLDSFGYGIEYAFGNAADHGNAAAAELLIPHVMSARGSSSSSYLPSALAIAAAEGHAHVVRILLRARVSVNWIDWDGHTLLHHAARCGQSRVVKQLLWYKAVLHSRTRGGQTALDLATNSGRFATAAVLRRFAAKENTG